MRRITLAMLLLAVPSVVAAPAPFPKSSRRTDLDKMQGEWTCAMVWKVIIRGDRLSWRRSHESHYRHEYRIRLARPSSPKAMSLICLKSDDTSRIGASYAAIYRIKVDRIVICEGLTPDARPSSFDSNHEECMKYELYRGSSGR